MAKTAVTDARARSGSRRNCAMRITQIPHRQEKPLPKLPVDRSRNALVPTHPPASNRNVAPTEEVATAVAAQIRAARMKPTSVLKKFTITLPSR